MNDDRVREVLADFDERVLALRGTQPSEVVDGRVANRLRNREKVIDALIESLRAGESGTIDEIVARSGVARRSIFRHFTDISDLFLAGFRHVLLDSLPRGVITDLGVGTLEDRIDAFVASRLGSLEVTYEFRAAARARLSGNDAVRDGLTVIGGILRDQISNQFARELAGRSEVDVERVVDSVLVLTSFESFDVLVAQLGRPVEAVRSIWTRAVPQLLG